jgi:hypothetical protein
LVYDSSVRLGLATLLILAAALPTPGGAQERELSKPESPKREPKYDETFSGSIIELSTSKITVSRSILGKPAEKRVFLITSETRIEGKCRLKQKVTIGFVTTDDGDLARLIVVRQKPPDKK